MGNCKRELLQQRIRRMQLWYKFRLWNWTWVTRNTTTWDIKLGREVNTEDLRKMRSRPQLREMTYTGTKNSTPVFHQDSVTMKTARGTSSAPHASGTMLSRTKMAQTRTWGRDQNLKTLDHKNEAPLPNSTQKLAPICQSHVTASLTECLKTTSSNTALLVALREGAAKSMDSMKIWTQEVGIIAKTEKHSSSGTHRISINMSTRIMEWSRSRLKTCSCSTDSRRWSMLLSRWSVSAARNMSQRYSSMTIWSSQTMAMLKRRSTARRASCSSMTTNTSRFRITSNSSTNPAVSR